jgi:hypothetical protein
VDQFDDDLVCPEDRDSCPNSLGMPTCDMPKEDWRERVLKAQGFMSFKEEARNMNTPDRATELMRTLLQSKNRRCIDAESALSSPEASKATQVESEDLMQQRPFMQ